MKVLMFSLLFISGLFGSWARAHENLEFICSHHRGDLTSKEVKLTMKRARWFWEVSLVTISGFPYENFSDRLGNEEIFMSYEKEKLGDMKDQYVYKYDFYPKARGIKTKMEKVLVSLSPNYYHLFSTQAGQDYPKEFEATFRYVAAETPKASAPQIHEDIVADYICRK